MKERIVQLLDLEQLTPSKFADIIGVQRSSVSHVISGRNNPSFDFLQKTLKAFPGLNADWLILGQGTMYEKMGRGIPGTLFDTTQVPFEEVIPGDIPDNANEENRIEPGKEPSVASSAEPTEVEETVPQREKGPEGKVIQVMVFYDNDTFRSYRPSE